MTILHIDFETFSAADLKAEGLARYALDPSTGVHCMAFAFDDEPVWLADMQLSGHHAAVRLHVEDGGIVYAHNAPFELAIWNQVCVPRYGWPKLDPKQVRCTMAMCYAMALPGALENAAPALGITERKDAAGKRVMLQLAQPKPDGTFWTPADAPEKFAQLYAYCRQDVEVERALHHRLMELSPAEQRVWQLDYEINERGVQLDLRSIDKALAIVHAERQRLDAEMLRVTGGVVGACTEVQLLVKWIRMQGVEVGGLAKSDVLDALSGDLPAPVRRALALRQEAAKSSTAKLVAMKQRAGADGRVRGIHQYHGANTGRWAGRGIQTQNLPRPRPGTKPAHVDDMFAHLHDKQYVDVFHGPAMDAVADCIRGMLIPAPGHDLVAMDFSAIEARVLAWLAGQESVLDIFRTHGQIYEHAAAGIYRVAMEAVTKEQRQVGKVAVLALGYGGGVGAFQSMAKNYGVKVPDDQADEIKAAWRAAHPAIVSYWYGLEEAAELALRTGGTCGPGTGSLPPVLFKQSGSFLWCRLPSGRVLCYPYPEMRVVTTPWGAEKDALTYMTTVTDKKVKIVPDAAARGSWQRISTYGGSLAENVTQAVARDLLAEALVRLDDAGFRTVMHVHDEAVVEIASSCDDHTVERIEQIMAAVPSWAVGLPISAEGWRAKRYRK